jgi:hypothetical protein
VKWQLKKVILGIVRKVIAEQSTSSTLDKFITKGIANNYFRGKRSIPRDTVKKDIIAPTPTNNVIVIKFRKNCFFLTWKLMRNEPSEVYSFRRELNAQQKFRLS